MNIIERLRSNTRKSAFNKQGYRVTCEVGNLYRNLRFYSESKNENTPDNLIVQSMIPPFQRDNDKWGVDRKVKFVENIMCGYPTDIILFSVNSETKDDCGIIDGQQRLTAIDDWFNDKFPIYGDIYYSDLSHLKRAPFVDCRVSFVIHDFKSMIDAVDFYIDINEGISHSSDDILRAKKYRDSLSK